ncbi:shikimate dehydrogenase [Aphanizomenon flos-aquae NRERC-008]|jgi:shikimate dehydrogenase|uniref:Shikimate dehydrogenase (NADP(+)) n=1 Tax=Aphanizomenon flos-aquae FACHB-1249 TaxID=2692889 RepID=A0ABR8IWA2_APHFL|nr:MULTISPECIES: shikimate dehydrogenase [Aphanizomenon]MCE2903714.1 shikimate dehydrogenase [Anabaena sp. CoA2_C59]MDJ0507279.1 shikimate dehydrogenase [Nostocales cyanobacterium LE14-WE12]MBD2391524.1 shikimate dehydrogenase [Aphanizomenon flos-aquae FACHB-1171]MBD2556031.1 shikimate dehydrogenase [Aphanizomenon flos-aquae FACHB-1290]MBD2633167.1 shikimate dehydrogenase [Aphanizomenon sp. FACHB-1399]
MITGKTKLLGVIGHPVEHSLSPVMHNAALAKLGLDYVYLPFPISPENLATAIAGFASIGIVGFSITIPHKQAILPLLSTISPIAQVIGAVNTVTRQGDTWVGTNTDVEGFIAPLQTTYHQDWSQKKAVILGNGGAARAVVAGCIQLGLAEIHVVGRNWQKLQAFRQSWQNSPFADQFQIHEWTELPNLLHQANLLVNTTPIGMYPHINDSPLSSQEISYLPQEAIVYDLIYIPKPSKFLHLAETQGAIIIDGLEMLVQQGAAALKIWLQRETVPVTEMRQALQNHLGI